MAPDATGNFKGIAVPAAAWERVFGSPAARCDCARPDKHCAAKAAGWVCPRKNPDVPYTVST